MSLEVGGAPDDPRNLWVEPGKIPNPKDAVDSGGARFEHHVVRLGRISIALIVNERDEALMLWRHRLATDQWGYELVGGVVEAGEQPVATAAREAREESGWQPVGKPEPLVGTGWPYLLAPLAMIALGQGAIDARRRLAGDP